MTPTERDERYEVMDEEVQRALRTIATLVNEELPDGMAFALFLMHFGEHAPPPAGKGAVFYISNGDRAGVLDAVKAWVARQEARR